MKIAITGVTGKLGGAVARLVSEAGLSAVHLARSPEKAQSLPHAELRRAAYEYTPEALAALAGVDALFMVSAAEGPARILEHYSFLDAAKDAGVKHIVYTSFYGASPQSVFLLARDHAATESAIRELGFSYTFLRDNFYQDFFAELGTVYGEIRGPAGRGKCSAVARQDVAEVAAKVLARPDKWAGRSLDMTGPEELSMAEFAAALSAKLGKAVPYVEETVEEAYASRKKWEAEPWQYEAWVSTYTAIAAGEQAGVSGDVERVLGRPATSFAALLQG